jgi:hypothetical protein
MHERSLAKLLMFPLDKNSRKGTKVDVAANAWKADATKKALGQRQAARQK